jgi:DUF177 domain-containing protein
MRHMVSFNVSQLLLLGPGAVREFDFSEPLPDPADELHLRGPVSGHARLLRTSEGILAHSDYHTSVALDCSRCLEDLTARVDGELDEEFVPSTDIRTGLPLAHETDDADEPNLINEHHEIELDEVLRQNILINLPLHPLCQPDCPGLCPTCGERLGAAHPAHAEREQDEAPVNQASPFARLAVLLQKDDER